MGPVDRFNPHWGALTPETRQAFDKVASLPFINQFYLAGGSGLALHLGHRFSVDLDFFSPAPDAVGPKVRAVLREALDDPTLSITTDEEGRRKPSNGVVFLSDERQRSKAQEHAMILPDREQRQCVAYIVVLSVSVGLHLRLSALVDSGYWRFVVEQYEIGCFSTYIPTDPDNNPLYSGPPSSLQGVYGR